MKLKFLISVVLIGSQSWAAVPTAKKPVSQKTQINVPRAPTKSKAVSKSSEFANQLKRDRALVLQKKNELEGKVARPLPTAKEKQLFEELVQAYERNDELSFASRFQAMVSEHQKSIYMDETLYLAGMMAFGNKQYGKAVRMFSQVVKDFPRSGKVRAALFAKAAAYRKMNLKPQAVDVFKAVKSKYPGSPESRRAEVELRLIK